MKNIVTMDLQNPVTIKENEIEILKLNLDELKGQDMIEAVRHAGGGNYLNIKTPIALMYLASKASGIDLDDLINLSLNDSLELLGIMDLYLSGNLGLSKYGEQLLLPEK